MSRERLLLTLLILLNIFLTIHLYIIANRLNKTINKEYKELIEENTILKIKLEKNQNMQKFYIDLLEKICINKEDLCRTFIKDLNTLNLREIK